MKVNFKALSKLITQINIYKNTIGALGLKNGTGINALGPGAKFEIKDDTIRFNTIGIKLENAWAGSRIRYNAISDNKIATFFFRT